MPDQRVVVEVPATSANLGPGFDSLGLALGVRDVIEAAFTDSGDVRVQVVGEGRGQVPTDGNNLVARIIRTGLAAFDESGELARRGLALTCTNVIPHSRGMGSSAAAIVGALTVAAHLSGSQVSPAQMVALATRLEGHPDNVAPGVLGGATIAWMALGPDGPGHPGGQVGRATSMAVHPDIQPVLAVPADEASTSRARGALPATVAHADAAFNAARAALLVHALTVEPALLLEATDDRLHQRQRRAVYPDSMALVEALRERGVAAAISGAGPSVIALAVGDRADQVAALVESLAGPAVRVLRPGVSAPGARRI